MGLLSCRFWYGWFAGVAVGGFDDCNRKTLILITLKLGHVQRLLIVSLGLAYCSGVGMPSAIHPHSSPNQARAILSAMRHDVAFCASWQRNQARRCRCACVAGDTVAVVGCESISTYMDCIVMAPPPTVTSTVTSNSPLHTCKCLAVTLVTSNFYIFIMAVPLCHNFPFIKLPKSNINNVTFRFYLW